jgi:gliding motility-associated-like protein
MKTRYFVLFCFITKTKAQNLVPNYSFEDTVDCLNSDISNSPPWCSSGLSGTLHFTTCQFDPTLRTPFQYATPCIQSYQVPRTGNAYAVIGIYNMNKLTNYYSNPQVKLKDTLRLNKTYCVTFYVSLFNYCRYSTDKIGARLSNTPLSCIAIGSGTTNIAGTFTPQIVSPSGVQLDDTLNWMEVSGLYTALGNELYLSVGDFFLQSQHSIVNSYPSNCNGVAEYYLDDVSVEEVQLANCKNDTSICLGDSVLLGNNVSEATTYNWLPNVGLSCNTCANPKAKPLSTTTYTCFKTQCKANTNDAITITVKTDCNPTLATEALEVPNVFTPNFDGVNDTFYFIVPANITNLSFTIYNRWGLSLTPALSAGEGVVPSPRMIRWDGRTAAGEECSDGVYFYVLQYTDAKGEVIKKNGYITLIK